MTNYCQLHLTCANKVEADKIANTLLDKQLIVCAKQLPVRADYRWKGQIESANEIMLIMESRLDLFERIEQEVAAHHSYDVFVIEAVALAKVSANASAWLEESLDDK